MVLTNNFEDSSTQGWQVGNASAHPNPPTNVASGGPDGADDNFLQTEANGGAGAGSRLAFFNRSAEWTGDYTVGGVTGITASANNQGNSNIVLRVALDGAGGRFVTTEGITLSAGSGSDLFVFGSGDGTDTVLDFEVGIDRIGIVEGEFTFDDVTLTQEGANTVLGVSTTGETLAVLNNVQATALGESDFVTVPDVSNIDEALALI